MNMEIMLTKVSIFYEFSVVFPWTEQIKLVNKLIWDTSHVFTEIFNYVKEFVFVCGRSKSLNLYRVWNYLRPPSTASSKKLQKIYTNNVKIWLMSDVIAKFQESELIFDGWKLSFLCTCLDSKNLPYSYFYLTISKVSIF